MAAKKTARLGHLTHETPAQEQAAASITRADLLDAQRWAQNVTRPGASFDDSGNAVVVPASLVRGFARKPIAN